MSLLKQFWICAALLLVLVVGVIVLAIGDSADSASPAIPNTITETQSANTASQEASAQLASEPFLQESVPANFPAPAKKLYQLINDAELSDGQSLEEKTQQLNKQLAEINKRLKAQGIDVPEQQPQAVAIDSDTEQRLKAIKNHINQK
ncbi:MAG: hypothetical protein KTR20_07400 [Cellvibrionaceae bacterium]|nr:hypothetical protein [Cellvibrionaceae bacterium]